MPIRELPPVPTRDDPVNFALKGDAFLAALPGFREDANALEQSLQLVATTGTSTSTLTVGLGSKTVAAPAGKAWATGAWVYLFASAAVGNYMVGRVTSYNATTGALVVNVTAIDGSGTHSAWIVALATPQIDTHLVPRDGSREMTGALTLSGNAVNALEAVPKQQAEAIAAATRGTLASLSVTVNANAMTATLQPETLDFRSSTLSSGTPVSRTATAAATLTVPSAATLGTVNGQAARIVWGWLDNAGTLEPFVANLAGGLNLDETTLISTTAISGTANSAGTVYSQTARTNVAFRVRGFCDITQATAGTWATGPTLVQGVGGMALAALASLGYGQRYQIVTGSRAYGTTYYNTRGRPISVSTWSNAGSPGFLTAVVGGVVADFSQSTSTGTSQNNRVSFIVPPGASYVVNSSGTATLADWAEMY